jgi:hypothetical protein
MHTQRMVELCSEACDHAAEVVELIDEYAGSAGCDGAGICRDPANILSELREEALDLRAMLREQRDEIERLQRGL